MSALLPRSRRGRVTAGLLVAVVVIAVVVIVIVSTRGPSSPGDVTFSADGAPVAVGAAQFCDVQVTDCGDDADALAVVPVAPGRPLRIDVPEAVSSTPWQVAFAFRDAAGAEQRGRTPVFAPGTTPTYTLTLPDPAGQLETAEVQQYGARITQGPEGLTFATRATWVLRVAPG